jgi:hypothetical protein
MTAEHTHGATEHLRAREVTDLPAQPKPCISVESLLGDLLARPADMSERIKGCGDPTLTQPRDTHAGVHAIR